jgi:hypothetical protein
MRFFFAVTALAGLLASGIGCAAAPNGSESDSTQEASEALKTDGLGGTHLGSTASLKRCVEMVICIDGKHWNPATCSCVGPVCDPIACPSGEHWDSETCSCVGPVCDPIVCPSGSVWVESACAC